MMGSFASAMIGVSLLGLMPQQGQPTLAWHSDYGKALQSTKQLERPLLIVLDSKKAHPNTVPVRFEMAEPQVDESTEKLLNSYELCHVDVSTQYGHKVAQAFKATEFPYTAIIDKSGKKIIYRKVGTFSDSEWENVLTTHRKGERVVRAVTRPHRTLRPVFPNRFDPSYCPSCQQGW